MFVFTTRLQNLKNDKILFIFFKKGDRIIWSKLNLCIHFASIISMIYVQSYPKISNVTSSIRDSFFYLKWYRITVVHWLKHYLFSEKILVFPRMVCTSRIHNPTLTYKTIHWTPSVTNPLFVYVSCVIFRIRNAFLI